MLKEFESNYNSVVEAVYNHFLNFPEKLCLVDENREIKYKDFWNEIKYVAKYLMDRGIKKNECVLIECNQSIEYCVIGFAIQYMGGIFVPIELNSAREKILSIIDSTNSKLFITINGTHDTFNATYKDIYNDFKNFTDDYTIEFPHLEDNCELLFTTGTTGKSKGILLNHKNVVAIAQNVAIGLEIKKDNIEIIPITLSHSHGLRRYYGNMINGSTCILIDGVIKIKKFYEFLEKYKATAIDLTPSALQIIFKLSKNKLSDYNKQLDYIQLGSSKLPDSDKEILRQLLPDVRLYDFYGSTEAGCSCLIDFNKDYKKHNSIGKPAYNAHFIIVDPKNFEIILKNNEHGLLATSGHMNMVTYWKQDELAKSITYNNYIVSSDLGYIDEEGFVYMLGRIDYVINYGGIKISPDEIETILIRYPNIKDCACMGISNEISGQIPIILYSLKEEVDFDLADFVKFVNKNIDANKLPKKYIEVNEILRASNGKILRNKLKELYD